MNFPVTTYQDKALGLFELDNRKLQVKRLSDNAVIPKFQTTGAAGFDLHASEEFLVMPGDTVIIKTGLAFAIPEGYEIQIRPRSGISVKTKARVIIGTIDSDYRGEVGIILDNTGTLPYTVEKGARIAQGVLSKVEQCNFFEVEELSTTERGQAAFGSTGV